MAPQTLFDISGIDLDAVLLDAEAIESYNPHRGAMRMIDAVVWESPDKERHVAYRDIGGDEFWVPGHIPGRPIFPGVLMIEAAAQLASLQAMRLVGKSGFIGFAGVDKVKFRGQVVPGNRLTLLAMNVDCRPRRCIAQVQGYVDGTLCFESSVTGMPL